MSACAFTYMQMCIHTHTASFTVPFSKFFESGTSLELWKVILLGLLVSGLIPSL